MRESERALGLAERIYEAVAEPAAWHDFVAELSDLLGGAAINLSLRLPDEVPTEDSFFRVGLDPRLHGLFLKLALEGLPWGTVPDDPNFASRFVVTSEVVNEKKLECTGLYQEYMRPQGLAAEWPIVHLIASEAGRPLAGIAIYQREGGRPIGADDLALLDALVPHLRRAYALHCQLRDTRQHGHVLTEVIDRLQTGILLVDEASCAVLMNRSAARILAVGDGLYLQRNRPCARDPGENRRFQQVVQQKIAERGDQGPSRNEVMVITRPQGKRPLPLMIGTLLAAQPDTATNAARAVIFMSDPDGRLGTSAAIETLYGLTPAEAELVRLISEGRSLEQVAAARGVTMNTVRSQLKQVFSKTDTSRQGELVHLVLSGVAGIRSGEDP
jgi:DNA-binding CsgD family transcriptional regulator